MSEWKKVKFLDFIVLQRGFDLTKDSIKDGPYPVVCSTSIMGYHNNYKVEGPGVVTGRSGTLGETQYVKGNFWPHNTTLFVKDFKGNNRQFVYYFLKNFDIASMGGGAAIPSLNRNVLSNLSVTIPDLSIQNNIATILSRYDSLIENYQQQIKLLEEAAQRLYKEWFVDLHFPGHENAKIVDGVPEGWEKKKLADVCDTIGGGTPSTKVSSYYEGGTISWVTPTDITRNNSLCLLSTEKKITKEGLNHSSAKMLPKETILMTSRASVGYFGICDFEVCTNQGFISCVPFEKNFQMYLLYNLMNRVEEIRIKAGGSTYLEISKSVFRNFDIICPPQSITVNFQCQTHRILEKTKNISKQIRLLTEARDRLLPKLMSGEIAV